MITRSKIVIAAVSLATVPAFAAPLAGTKYEQAQIDEEIRSCLAELGNHADYRDATQVRHEITVAPRRSIGHKLDIRTSVYAENSESAIRAYVTRCLVYRDNKPVRFDISETDPDA